MINNAISWVKRNKFILFLTVSLMYFANFFHIYQNYHDLKLQSYIENKISKNKIFYLADFFEKNTEYVCFLQSYAKPSQIKNNFISNVKKSELIINTFPFNQSDAVWWLLLVEENKVVNIYKLNSSIRPKIKGYFCGEMNKILISPTKNNNFYITTK